jgi:AcrR family transcriptional regulator
MPENTDRRIRRTNRTLAAALIALTSERPYASIQVRDITDRADVGYATFYRHYDSKDDLMLAVFEDIMEELESSSGDPGVEYFEQEGVLLFGHVQKYKGLYASIIQSQEFVMKLKNLLSTRIEGHIVQHASILKDRSFPLDLAAHHMVVALVGLIEWWLENDLRLPIVDMARIYKRLIIQATWYALESSNPMTSFEHF